MYEICAHFFQFYRFNLECFETFRQRSEKNRTKLTYLVHKSVKWAETNLLSKGEVKLTSMI